MNDKTALEQIAQSPLMAGHKPQGPAQAYVYHPEEARKGILIPVTELENYLSKPGWVDTPANFPKSEENLALTEKEAAAKTEQIVEQAVKEEKRRQASGEVEVVEDPIPAPEEIEASDDPIPLEEEKPKTKRKAAKRKGATS